MSPKNKHIDMVSCFFSCTSRSKTRPHSTAAIRTHVTCSSSCIACSSTNTNHSSAARVVFFHQLAPNKSKLAS